MTHPTQDRTNAVDRPVVSVMTRPVSSVPAAAGLAEALRELRCTGSRHLVAVDGTGRVAGVVGGRQLVAAWASDPEKLAVMSVAAVLDSVPPTVAPSATLRTVARVMRDHRSDVVVVAGTDRTAIGIVTADDLVAALAQ
jgi:CBS domain-containing protein